MATAKRTMIKREIVTEVPGITLTLTEDQALTLMCITYRVGGNINGRSRRSHIKEISNALKEVGFSYDTPAFYAAVDMMSGDIDFADEEV